MEDLSQGISSRRQALRLGLVALAWLLTTAAAVARFRGWTADDFYITYRYAENLARGLGFVYNPGERVFGLSDPGLGLLLAVLHLVTRVPADWLAGALFGTALIGTAILLLREGEACGRFWETALGGSLLVTSSLLWANQGAAAPMTLLALLAAASLADRHPWWAGTIAGLAVWLRPDAGAGVAILLLLLFLEKKRFPWKTGLAAAAVIALGLLCAWGWFGAALPGTLGAKIEMAEATPGAAVGAEGFWRRGATPLQRHLGPAWLLFVALGLVGLWPFAQNMRRLGRLTVLYGGSMAVLYPLLGVPFFFWYILLPVIALLYGLPFCLLGLGRAASGSSSPQRLVIAAAGPAVAAVLVILLAGHALRTSLLSFRDFAPPARLTVYKEAAEWIRRNSRPEDSIAYVEIGVLGYYSRRPLEDQMGLVTPRVLPFVRRNDIAGGFLTKPTDYVIFHTRGRMAPIVKAPWFSAAYKPVKKFRDQGFRAGRLVIYRRKPGISLPHPPPVE